MALRANGVWMLFLVGTGISEDSITLEGINACTLSENIYIDTYTSTVSESKIQNISSIINKKIERISRSEMEENIGKILSKEKNTVILVGGDPLIATTHKIIYIEAAKMGVQVKAIHSSSIISSIMGESGLDFYRFGQIVTIARWSEHYKPISFYDTIKRNMDNNLHTILLLDYDQKEASSIPINEAIMYIEQAEKDKNYGIVNERTKIMIIEDLSQKNEKKLFINIKEAKTLDNKKGMRTILLPAKITEVERDTINVIFGR